MPNDDEILAQLEASLGHIEEPDDVMDVQAMPESALVRKLAEVRGDLQDMKEMHGDPTTDKARELHSERAAVLLEMRRRGML